MTAWVCQIGKDLENGTPLQDRQKIMGGSRCYPDYKNNFTPPHPKALPGSRQPQTSTRNQLTLLSHVLVQHQFAMPEEVQYGPEVGGVSVNEVGPGLILWR